MVIVFKRLFAKDILQQICHMWWDLLRYFGDDPDEKVKEVMLEALSEIINIESFHCQGSALHGLGHLEHPERAEIIDGFLASHPEIAPELLRYAQSAREGNIL